MTSEAYLRDTDPRTPLASSLHADRDGLPPVLIQVGTAEILFDDATQLADLAHETGEDMSLDTVEDMCQHGIFFDYVCLNH